MLVVRDSPSGSLRRHDAVTLRQAGHDLRSAWQHPGTRLGLWTHFTTQFSGTVFALLWGYPFLVSGEGLSRGGASRPVHRCSCSSAPWPLRSSA